MEAHFDTARLSSASGNHCRIQSIRRRHFVVENRSLNQHCPGHCRAPDVGRQCPSLTRVFCSTSIASFRRSSRIAWSIQSVHHASINVVLVDQVAQAHDRSSLLSTLLLLTLLSRLSLKLRWLVGGRRTGSWCLASRCRRSTLRHVRLARGAVAVLALRLDLRRQGRVARTVRRE